MAYKTLHDRLKGDIATALKKELGVENLHALPRIEKVVVNVGINKSKMDGKETQAYITDCLAKITGQQPVLTKAKKAISNFKVRQGMPVGLMVTMRGKHMEEFLDRLISYSLPRVRDFRGLSTKLDGHGNYSIGLRDHSIFPEVPPADAKQIFGMQITIRTTTNDDEQALALFKQVGVPFKPEKKASEKAEEARIEKEAQEAKKVQEEEEKKAEEEKVGDEKESKEAPASVEATADKKEENKKDDASVESKADSTDTPSSAEGTPEKESSVDDKSESPSQS